jgi:hypothetical protein
MSSYIFACAFFNPARVGTIVGIKKMYRSICIDGYKICIDRYKICIDGYKICIDRYKIRIDRYKRFCQNMQGGLRGEYDASTGYRMGTYTL